MCGELSLLEVYTYYTSRRVSGYIKPRWSEGGCGNRCCGIYRSPSCMPANQPGSPSSTTSLEPMEDKQETFIDATNRSRFQQKWQGGLWREGECPDIVTWWKKYVKRKIRFFCIQEGTERTREVIINENFYYSYIYDILKDSRIPREKHPIKPPKAKFFRLHNKSVLSIVI